jgi:hypothetical protein
MLRGEEDDLISDLGSESRRLASMRRYVKKFDVANHIFSLIP